MVKLGCALCRVAHGDQIDVAADEEAVVGVQVLVNAHSQYGDIRAIMLKLNQGRHFLDTWRAPGCPEVEQDDAAAVTGQVNGSGPIGNGEVRGDLACLGGMRASVASLQKGQRRENGERD